MFTIAAYNNPYLRIGQSTLQAVLSIGLDANVALAPAPLALAIVLDRSGSMDGAKMRATRDGAVKVVQALEPTMSFMVVTFNDTARVIFGPAPGTGIDPLLGGTQTWKLSHWRFIKKDEKERENTLYVYRLSIPYNHLFVKKDHFLSVLLVFQSLLDSDIPKKNVFVFDCKTLRCSQRSLFLPLFCSEKITFPTPSSLSVPQKLSMGALS